MTWPEALKSSKLERWGTPAGLAEALAAELCVFGTWALDACAEAWSAKAPRYHSIAEGRDALELDWSGEVWCNPPYGRGRIEAFVDRGIAERDRGAAHLVCYLVPARTSTRWFRRLEAAADEVRLFSRRLQFVEPPDVAGGARRLPAPFDSALVILRRRAGSYLLADAPARYRRIDWIAQ